MKEFYIGGFMMKVTVSALLFLVEALVVTFFILLSRKWFSEYLKDNPHVLDNNRKCLCVRGIMF
jgi:uncharacterized protein YneF (UPF0154 family)